MFVKKIINSSKIATKIRNRISFALLKPILFRMYPVATDKKLIRFGPEGDGGYLIPDDLDGIKACFSPGVSSISGFELECAELGIDVYLADASVESPADEHPRFHFRKAFIGHQTKGDFITMDDWMRDAIGDQSGDMILQMDIEGWEYKALNAISEENLNRFRIIILEFHGLDYLLNYKIRAFRKLLKNHSCVHIHPNNCCAPTPIGSISMPRMMEFTFLRNDRIKSRQFQCTFPHPLDGDNTSNPSIVLPDYWYHQPRISKTNESSRA
jgi:hypothetical protein